MALALLSPLILGNAKKVDQLFEAAEAAYERSDYEDAIRIYKAALKESNKLAVKTEHIDQEFTTLANLKIAQCYYEFGEKTSDVRHYQNALTHIKEVVRKTQVRKHEEELTYLWAENLYKINDLDQAKSKFSWLIETFPNSRWVPEAKRRISELTPPTDNNDKPIPNPDPIPITILNTASDLKLEGKVYNAYQRYTDLITQYPDSEYVADAYVGRAEIHLDAKDYVNARANYEEAIYSTEDAERKKELYEAYHRTYFVPDPPNPNPRPDPPDELFVDARLLRKEKRYLEAAKIYEQLANSTLSTEDTAYALYWMGRCYCEAALRNQTLFNKSVDAFIKFITDHESSSDTIKAYYHLALAYTEWAKVPGNQSKWQLVVDTVEAAHTKYANKDKGDNTVQGWLSRMQELKDTADTALNPKPVPIPEPEPVSPDPKPDPKPEPDPPELTRQAQRHFRRGQLKAATKKAKQARRVNPNHVPAQDLLKKIKEKHYGRGWTFFDEGNYTKAISEFRSAISIDPNFKEAHCHLGVIYIEKEQYTEAKKALKKAIDIDEEFKEAHFNLALAHLELGEFEDARNAANAALRIDPNYEPARMLIEFIAN